jgi:hypothetical protein
MPVVYRLRTFAPGFSLQMSGEPFSRIYRGAASEAYLFNMLSRAERYGRRIEWLEVHGHPLTPRCIGAINVLMRYRGIRRWMRAQENRKRAPRCTWTRFCQALGLEFDGKNVRTAA